MAPEAFTMLILLQNLFNLVDPSKSDGLIQVVQNAFPDWNLPYQDCFQFQVKVLPNIPLMPTIDHIFYIRLSQYGRIDLQQQTA
jgi:hypothetical protein